MKEKEINAIFNILVQFEKIFDEEDCVTVKDYCNYLDRLYIQYLGSDQKEIADVIKGLYIVADKAPHETVKRVVFHIINIISKR